MKNNNSSNLTLWLILGICVLPFLLATGLFLFWNPTRTVNYGNLLDPQPIENLFNKDSEAIEELLSQTRGKWSLLTFDSGECSASCQKKLYWMRQVRLTQGREMDRVERVWFINDSISPEAKLLNQFPQIIMINLYDEELFFQSSTNAEIEDHIFVMDPLGNLMMRYPAKLDPGKLKKDLKKLLKVSKGTKYQSTENQTIR